MKEIKSTKKGSSVSISFSTKGGPKEVPMGVPVVVRMPGARATPEPVVTIKHALTKSKKGKTSPIDELLEPKIPASRAVPAKVLTTAGDVKGFEFEKKTIGTAVDINTPVLLIGETGTGKTSLIKALAFDHKKKVVRVNLNGQTSKDEFVGKYILKGKDMVWVDGPLITAMKEGQWLLVDEINAALAEILFILHSVLDDERAVLLAEKDNEIIHAHPEFRFFATMNPSEDYAGTKELNKAFMSRFGVVLNIDFIKFDQEVDVVVSRTGIDEATAKRLVSLAIETRKLKVQQQLYTCISTRDLINCATLITKKVDQYDALNMSYLQKISAEERKLLEEKGLVRARKIEVPVIYTQKEVDALMVKAKKDKATIIKEYQENIFKKISEDTDADVRIS